MDYVNINEGVSEKPNTINKNSEDEKYIWEGTSVRKINEDEPGENEYGGFWGSGVTFDLSHYL